MDFDETGQLLIIHCAFVKYVARGGGGAERWAYNEAFHQLFTDFKKAYDSVRKEVLHNILIEFGTPMKMVRLIKMCLD